MECFHYPVGFTFTGTRDYVGKGIPEVEFHDTGLYDVDGPGACPKANTSLREFSPRSENQGKFKPPSLRTIAPHHRSAPSLRTIAPHHRSAPSLRTFAPHLRSAPSLRSIALTAPYMHDGSILTLEAVIYHSAAGGRAILAGPNEVVGRKNPNSASVY